PGAELLQQQLEARLGPETLIAWFYSEPDTQFTGGEVLFEQIQRLIFLAQLCIDAGQLPKLVGKQFISIICFFGLRQFKRSPPITFLASLSEALPQGLILSRYFGLVFTSFKVKFFIFH